MIFLPLVPFLISVDKGGTEVPPALHVITSGRPVINAVSGGIR